MIHYRCPAGTKIPSPVLYEALLGVLLPRQGELLCFGKLRVGQNGQSPMGDRRLKRILGLSLIVFSCAIDLDTMEIGEVRIRALLSHYVNLTGATDHHRKELKKEVNRPIGL